MAVAFVAAGCRRGGAPDALPFTRDLITAGRPAGERPNVEATLRALQEIAENVRRERRAALADSAAQVLARVVFAQRGFEREIDDKALRFMQLDHVLTSKRGSCVGLAALFLALGEIVGPELGFIVNGVLVPGHFFVRVSDRTGTHNVELLRRGEEMPDTWYRPRFHVPASGAPAYMRALERPEILAVLAYNLGNDLRQRGRLNDAQAAFASAARAFPQMAEASASLGTVLHMLGRLPEADASYAAARAADPTLEGLDRNIGLLRAEAATANDSSAPAPPHPLSRRDP